MSKIIPLIILKEDQTILDCALINEKGVKKSIENSQLWAVHPQTGRLLPYSNQSNLIRLKQNQEWAEATVTSTFQQNEAMSCAKAVETVDNVNFVQKNEVSQSLDNAENSTESVLLNLEKVIQERHKQMPEGSYTTHLFQSGGEKIRKKTGEEAVELILASEKKEILYEAADLIYHLMVLLESENLSITQVLAELKGRE